MTADAFTPEQLVEFDRLAQRYSWDLPLPEARDWPDRLFRRVMDMGVIDDVVALEQRFGTARLRTSLATSGAGEFRPKSWAWWHYRLDVTPPGKAPPPLPLRRIG